MTATQIQTDKIGDYLQERYGSIYMSQNTHIRCFYIKLGKEMCQIPMIQKRVTTALEKIPSLTEICFKTEPGWDGVFVFEVPEPTTNDERVHEAEINAAIHLKLTTDLSTQGIPVSYILSRACLYKENTKRAISQEITTDKIGDIMASVYKNNAIARTHIEYFYLFVQAVVREKSSDTKQLKINDEKVHSEVLEELKTLPGNWEAVESRTWPGTFFGFFPKGIQLMNERERERILNGEVRMPLIERLGAKLESKKLHDSFGLEPKVQVIITRAL